MLLKFETSLHCTDWMSMKVKIISLMDMELGTNWWSRELEDELIPAGELMLLCHWQESLSVKRPVGVLMECVQGKEWSRGWYIRNLRILRFYSFTPLYRITSQYYLLLNLALISIFTPISEIIQFPMTLQFHLGTNR